VSCSQANSPKEYAGRGIELIVARNFLGNQKATFRVTDTSVIAEYREWALSLAAYMGGTMCLSTFASLVLSELAKSPKGVSLDRILILVDGYLTPLDRRLNTAYQNMRQLCSEFALGISDLELLTLFIG
jgi:hypothetical protein